MTRLAGPRADGSLNIFVVVLLLVFAASFALLPACTGGDDEERGRDDDDDTGDDDTGDDDDGVDPGAVVDEEGDVGKYSSLELEDQDGDLPRISYYSAEQGLKFAAYEDDSWRTDIVDGATDGGMGLYTSMRRGMSGDYHISYYDQTNGDLRYAAGTIDAGWEVQIVDGTDGADVGRYSFFDPLPNTNPAIAYYDATNEDLRYAYQSSGEWIIEVVDSFGGVGTYCSLDHHPSDGTAYVAYYDADNGNLKLATRAGNWQIEYLDSGENVGKWTSLRADHLGNIHVAYYDEARQNLKYAWFLFGGEDWTLSTIDSEGYVGANAELALDENLRPWIVYQDQDFVDVKLAHRSGSSWDVEAILEDGTYGFWMSLDIDSGGDPVFSHYHPIRRDLLIYPPRVPEEE